MDFNLPKGLSNYLSELDRFIEAEIRPLPYGPTHRFGTVRRVKRWGDATAVDG